MKIQSIAVLILGFLASFATLPTNAANSFDYYVLVLSWSPDFCANNPNASKEPQCDIGRKYGFVLHGLWPQYEKGYPQSCSNTLLPDNVAKSKCGIFPSAKLCGHEWKKHGTCSGLDAAGYLSLSEKLKNSVVIPVAYQAPTESFRTSVAQLKGEFIKKNNKFSNESIAPYCSGSGRFLQEIFFCYDKAEQPRACSQEVLQRSAKSCAQNDGFVVRNVR